jgi:hypothetical protein
MMTIKKLFSINNIYMKLFDKLKQGSQRLFDKVKSNAPRFLGKLSSGLQQGSNILRQGAKMGSQVINNPLFQAGAGALGFPELGAISSVINGANKAAQILGKSSRLTDVSSYRGDAKQVSNDILQRAKNIRKDLNEPSYA